jgi:hypothetical protein
VFVLEVPSWSGELNAGICAIGVSRGSLSSHMVNMYKRILKYTHIMVCAHICICIRLGDEKNANSAASGDGREKEPSGAVTPFA